MIRVDEPVKPRPVKYFVGILVADASRVDYARALLEGALGPVDQASPVWPFDYTDYYAHEMGAPLFRAFLSLADLADPGDLARRKRLTNDLESQAAERFRDVPRPLNLDVGYLGLSKLVLASTKDASHRIYLDRGIYGEVTLRYVRGTFEVLPWTYPDFRSSTHHDFFRELRRRLKGQLKEGSSGE